MPSRSTSSTELGRAADGEPAGGRPVFGRPSPAAASEPALRPAGEAANAAWRAEGGSAGWCLLRAASVVGVRHRLAGQGSDDSYAWRHDESGLVVAVADGVGSVPGSAATAERACRAAVSAGAPSSWSVEEACRRAVDAANLASEGGGATTLVVAVIRRDGSGALARVGDSSAWAVDPEAGGLELFEPPDPERGDGATLALPAAGVEPEIRAYAAEPGSVLVLVTDGIADPWRDGPTTVAPALTAALLERPEPPALLSVIDFSRQGCHDDRTLIGVWLT